MAECVRREGSLTVAGEIWLLGTEWFWELRECWRSGVLGCTGLSHPEHLYAAQAERRGCTFFLLSCLNSNPHFTHTFPIPR